MVLNHFIQEDSMDIFTVVLVDVLEEKGGNATASRMDLSSPSF